MTHFSREHVLNEIRRLAAGRGGHAPGRRAFMKATGISPYHWTGLHWARWTDAVREAGAMVQAQGRRFEDDELLSHLAVAVRYIGSSPTGAELRMFAAHHPGFPSQTTYHKRFGPRSLALARLRVWALENEGFADVVATVDAYEQKSTARLSKGQDRGVYLIRCGEDWKIGQTNHLKRRYRQIINSLPGAATLEHWISTDDPPGVETYWHRRFATKRVRGEWFRLSDEDVAAFKRWNRQ